MLLPRANILGGRQLEAGAEGRQPGVWVNALRQPGQWNWDLRGRTPY
jgi:hypothetical protein